LGFWFWAFGFWGFGVGAWAQTPKPQSPIPNPQSPKNSKLFLNKNIAIKKIKYKLTDKKW